IIHRDLAARNILLDNNYVCKVTDFGMAYQSFKYGHGNAKKGRLPIKWTAPEILLGELAGLSTLSDVYCIHRDLAARNVFIDSSKVAKVGDFGLARNISDDGLYIKTSSTAGEEGRKCLMREIELGKLIGENVPPNIVKFVGCVTTEIHPILIMEYMPCGDLLGYLRKCRGVRDRYYLGEGRAQDLTNYDLVMFAKQIAAGMVFLGSRGIIHRDLAARNILLDKNYVCKVTDFGMAYQSFKYGHGNAKKGCLPIKWTAPEILLGELAGLSTLSDVWSYGIVLYEIVTLGGIPYDGWSEGMVVAEVTKGYQMPKPDHVDNKVYDIMKRCWNRNPDFRPPFENLRKRMDKYLREETYVELLDMGAYDKAKYSRVEDLGNEGAGPSEEVAKKASVKRLGKWSSDRR
ncbi:hypothetical protein pdam_00003862, partial [Pocillopora damicornis]